MATHSSVVTSGSTVVPISLTTSGGNELFEVIIGVTYTIVSIQIYLIAPTPPTNFSLLFENRCLTMKFHISNSLFGISGAVISGFIL